LRDATVSERRAFKMRCPYCGDWIWFVRPENGGCFFCDHLGDGWDIHHCFETVQSGAQRLPKSLWLTVARGLAGSTIGSPNFEAEVTSVSDRGDRHVLVMLSLREHGIDLPMLGLAADDWRPSEGRLSFSNRIGVLGYREDGRERERILAGPCFDCWDLPVWERREASPGQLLGLGRDLGVRRFRAYEGLQGRDEPWSSSSRRAEGVNSCTVTEFPARLRRDE
jgi:hypothetical protein